ncbi:MAG: lactoylglutathione lyase [Gammaproteobacteria bacterium]|nr:lactoylglutathione lyase [Gammaproteobacteria bacterium]MCY4229201.1 lactoylglutathione lyase [Gammaproteobacteria bacterium]MCY4312343.1 lactoylglutathione lyase [Gammaproteobacteria bacterium]
MTQPEFKIDHTMLRVRDLEKSLQFYVGILGMKILRQNEYPNGRFTNTFVGYQDEDSGTTLELTYNWDQDQPYDRGNGWGHIALKVSDVYAASEYLKSHGVEFTKEPSPMKGGTRILAFIKDPDGYPIELNEPLSKQPLNS